MTEKKTPEAWCEQYGLEVRDPDGWRRDNTPFEQPITLPDFWSRYCGSTARLLLTSDQVDRITADVEAAKHNDEPTATIADLNNAYTERAHLVALLAALYPSHIGPAEDAPGWSIVFVQLPTGQATWHIAKDDMSLFAHVDTTARDDTAWDGHTTEQKYQRIREMTYAIATGQQPDAEGFVLHEFKPATPILCIQCLIDRHNGLRTDDPNPAQVMVNGVSSCLEHFQIHDGPPMPDRTVGGIIIPGANGSLN